MNELRVLVAAAAVFVLALVPAPPAARAVDLADTRLLAQPTASATEVAFTYAGDLWVSPRTGGTARRLTTHAAGELSPRFSPDGSLIAFTGQYDGNLDVYVVAAAGGEPRRLTWHPEADFALGFTPDGKAVLFSSGRASYTNRFGQLWTVPIEGGFPTMLPIPHASEAAYRPDGRKIAYTPLPEAHSQWKNYRGGTTSRIWIYDVTDHSVVEVPQPPGRCNDTDPAWIGSTLYFLSDRDGEFNLFTYDAASRVVERRTSYEDFPILAASAGGGRIVYEQAGFLHVFDPAAGKAERLVIGVAADLVQTRARYTSGDKWIRSASLSPSGARAVFELRGEIVTLPADKGDARNLTDRPGAHERSPIWSPDGGKIAYFSDASGEYQLHVVAQDGSGEARAYPLGGSGFYELPRWSPDGTKISYLDNSWSLWWLDLGSGETRKVAQETVYGPVRTQSHSWSPDSRWLVYTRNTHTYLQRVFLHEIASGRSTAITDGLSDVGEPVFDANGKYLYFTAATDGGPVRDWFTQSNSDLAMSRSLYVAVLGKDEASPLAPLSDEEKVEEAGEPAGAKADAKAAAKKSAVPPVEVDFDGLAARILPLPVQVTDASDLAAGGPGQLFFLDRPKQHGLPPNGQPPAGALKRFDVEKREATTLLAGVLSFSAGRGGKKLLVQDGNGWLIAGGEGPIDASKGRLAPGKVELRVDPRAEWRQIFDEAWRINRDYFYDPGMHGADWPAMREKYAAFLPHLATRSDLNRVLSWMSSELAVGHHRVFGGDQPFEVKTVKGGLLGADYEIDSGRYRFAKVYGGLSWNPDLKSPLTEPGVAVKAGEYLLAVAGRDLQATENLYQRFENTAGKTLELTVGPKADGSGSRRVKVVPIEDETALRNRAWVEGNLARVTAATGGRVAYVHVPDTWIQGHTYFKRYFYPQADREAIIVDERHNGGGLVADYVIDILRRPYVASWATRHGEDIESPLAAIAGPKVMLIDETAGSGGDLLPWMFRRLELGTLVGRRTWGGLVGILGFPTLLDGGQITAPDIGFWTEKDGFAVENEGVPPDVEVEQWPAEVIAGRDPQLEKAIEIALEQLAAKPTRKPVKPPFPIRVRR